jgi:dihydroxyacetone kinase-like predicted kinase
VEINGVAVKEGQNIGLLDDRLHTAGSSPEEVIFAMLEQLALEDFEIVTVFWGEDVTQAEAEQVAARIEALYADLEVELVEGSQPHYFYILSLE